MGNFFPNENWVVLRYRTLFPYKSGSRPSLLKAYPKVKNPKVGSFLRAPEDFEGLRSRKEKIIKTPSFLGQKIKWGEISYEKN